MHNQKKHLSSVHLSVSVFKKFIDVSVSVAQWKQQFLQFSNISERQICAFTQGEKEMVSNVNTTLMQVYGTGWYCRFYVLDDCQDG